MIKNDSISVNSEEEKVSQINESEPSKMVFPINTNKKTGRQNARKELKRYPIAVTLIKNIKSHFLGRYSDSRLEEAIRNKID